MGDKLRLVETARLNETHINISRIPIQIRFAEKRQVLETGGGK